MALPEVKPVGAVGGTIAGFEYGVHSGPASKSSSYGFKLHPSNRESQPQLYEPDEDHPCGAVEPREYSDGRRPLRCYRETAHAGWHAAGEGTPPYDKYPAILWTNDS